MSSETALPCGGWQSYSGFSESSMIICAPDGRVQVIVGHQTVVLEVAFYSLLYLNLLVNNCCLKML